jgi:glucose-6-phosphate-specific signal transduction histidine kinase
VVLAATPLIWALGGFVSRRIHPAARARRLLLVTVAVTAVAVLAAVAAVLAHGPDSLAQLRGITGGPGHR